MPVFRQLFFYLAYRSVVHADFVVHLLVSASYADLDIAHVLTS